MDKKTEKKTSPKKTTAKPLAEKKPRAPKKAAEEKVLAEVLGTPLEAGETTVVSSTVPTEKPTISKGRYVFATGRRKTAVANLRLFSGKGDLLVNKKPLQGYFFHKILQDTATRPFQLTGFSNDFHFTVTVNGGGMNSQAEAVRHALATALASMGQEIRNVMKKNGLLTRDSRKKERKKPGLRRARRAPQWAKR